MTVKNLLKILLILSILGFTIGCDRVSKNMVREKMHYNERINLLGNHLTITKVENTGAFLSLGNRLPKPVKLWIMIILPIVVLGLTFLAVFTKNNMSMLTIAGLCSITGGGIGNIYDRIMQGSVTDFLHMDFFLFQTGVFNMADVFIMTGMFLILLDMFLQRKKTTKPIPHVD
jgi:signal peptidase II